MRYKYFALFIVGVLLTGHIQAQAAPDWQPLTLNTNGTNGFLGVDALYTIVTCNNNDYILVQLNNHNNYTVKACWKDIVLNTSNEKLYSANAQDSVIVHANSSLRGNCTDINPQLAMKLTDFGLLKEDFKAFTTTGFDFIIIH